ncbi:SGM_3592 family protein [Streptomyces ipomoeae]|uniref:SGM_3592 family protein n=1 Tax=Streptomyces ipomoeae TaxID=103232 RepID=UPI0038D47850
MAGSGAGASSEEGAASGSGAGGEVGVGSKGEVGAGSNGGGAAGDGWDDVVLDQDFIRAAEAAEPSARARMLAARWREQAPDPQPWRSDEPPAGWFFSKARRRRWRRR